MPLNGLIGAAAGARGVSDSESDVHVLQQVMRDRCKETGHSAVLASLCSLCFAQAAWHILWVAKDLGRDSGRVVGVGTVPVVIWEDSWFQWFSRSRKTAQTNDSAEPDGCTLREL